MKTLPFEVKPGLEAAIVAHPSFQAGIWYGRPRHGHPEGAVAFHVRDVLANVEKKRAENPQHRDGPDFYEKLRVLAIVHDTFKYAVDKTKPKDGENHHGARAARFVETYFPSVGADVVLVMELHDDAFNAWNSAARFGKSHHVAQRRAEALLEKLKAAGAFTLYLAFFECDNGTEGKTRQPFEWFVGVATHAGMIA